MCWRCCGVATELLWPVISIGNTGNVGLPLCVFAFGAEGLGLGIAVFVVNSVGQFIFTPVAMSGEPPLRTLLTTPVVYGALIGLLLMFTDATVCRSGSIRRSVCSVGC